MDKHKFTPEKLTQAHSSTPEDKAKFLNDLAGFVRSGFNRNKFTKGLYRQLSNTFGHIAHYDIHGFYGNWFSSKTDQCRWIENALKYGCYGQATYTYCDAERQFQAWLKSEEGAKIWSELVEEARLEQLNDAREALGRAQAAIDRLTKV